MSDDANSPLQQALASAIATAPEARDYYDRAYQKRTGKSGKPIYDIVRGESKQPRVDTLRIIAEVMGLQSDHFVKIAYPKPGNVAKPAQVERRKAESDQPRIIRANEGTVRLRVIDLNLAMGDGGNLDDWASDDEYIDFDQSVLRLITRAPAESVIIAYPKGDSMFPTLLNGDMAVIDTTQTTLNLDGKIWACSIYGAGAVKRLNASGRGRIEVRSDNPIAGNREVDAEDVRILGRVIWVGREV